MNISRTLGNGKFIDIATALVIGSLGFFINAMYFTFEYFERTGNVFIRIWAEPVVHSLVIATIPLYLIIGYLYLREKRNIRELEASNKMKDLFTDILRHDLSNPAWVIQNTTKLMLDDPSADAKKHLEIIARNVNKQIEMIGSASKLSKLESTKELENESLDLRWVINNVVKDTKHLFKEADMHVDNRVIESMAIKANPMIEDIFFNLMSNTTKYAAEGKKVIIEALEEGKSYKVAVKDFGPGIPDKYKKDIFTRFKRMEKGGTKGTGLGLAIVQRIVALHNGRVWVEDNAPRGSIFYVKLPKTA